MWKKVEIIFLSHPATLECTCNPDVCLRDAWRFMRDQKEHPCRVACILLVIVVVVIVIVVPPVVVLTGCHNGK